MQEEEEAAVATDYGSVEREVEAFRLAGDWSSCLRALETYESIFECPTPQATAFHPSSLEMKAYYWLCMADATFHQNGDFSRTIDCLRRAAALCAAHPEFRTLAGQLLLKASFGIIRSQYDLELPQPQVDSVKLDTSERPLSLQSFLSDQLHLLDAATREMIRALSCAPTVPMELELLNCVLTTLTVDECVTICQSFPTSSLASETNKQVADLILTTCRHLLRDIDLRSSLELLAKQAISPYALWHRMDGLLCYSIISELLGDYASAKSTLGEVLEYALDASLSEVCEFFVLFAKCRRPFITAQCASPSQAADEVSLLLSLQPPLPPPLKAVMVTFLASCLMETQEAQFLEAYVALKHHVYLAYQSSAAETVKAFDDGHDALYYILPRPHSCLYYVNTISSNPWLLCSASQFSLGHVAVLLGALTHYLFHQQGMALLGRSVHRDTNDSSQPYDLDTEVNSILTWAFEAEVNPNPLVVFLLAQYHLRANRLGPALHALEVCQDLIASDVHSFSRQTMTIADRAVRLGFLHSPVHRAPYLALCQYGDLRLTVESHAGEIYGADGLLPTLQSRIVQALQTSEARFWEKWYYFQGDVRSESSRLFPSLLGSVRRIDDGLGDKYSVSLEVLREGLPPSLCLLTALEQRTAESLLADLCLLLLLAKLYATCGRNEKVDEETAFLFTCHAVRILAAIHQSMEGEVNTSETAKLPRQEAIEIWATCSLEYAVVLAELRLRAEATRCVQGMLTHAARHQARCWSSLEPRFYHLLMLLLSGQVDNPKACALATVLTKKLLPSMHVGAAATATSNGDISFGKPEHWNILFSHTLVSFAAGEGPGALAMAQALLQSLQTYFDPQQLARLQVANTIPAARSPLHTPYPVFRLADDSRTAVDILLGLMKMFMKMHRWILAKQAITFAWKLLYAMPEDLSRRLTQIMVAGTEPNLAEEVDLLRHVPTLLGWRLSHGCGFGKAHDLYAEAEVLAATAQLVQRESGDSCDPRAMELYSLAVATCALHVPSCCGLAMMYFEKFEQEAALAEQTRAATGKLIEGSSESLSLANYYVRTALRQRERSAEAWHVYSLVAGVLVSHAVALEAELTSAECRRSTPLRNFAAVFW